MRAARSVPSVKTTGGPKVTFKVGKPKQSKEESEESEEDKDDMATSFLQFWSVLHWPTIFNISFTDCILAQCARNRLSSPIMPSSIARKGVSSSLQPAYMPQPLTDH